MVDTFQWSLQVHSYHGSLSIASGHCRQNTWLPSIDPLGTKPRLSPPWCVRLEPEGGFQGDQPVIKGVGREGKERILMKRVLPMENGIIMLIKMVLLGSLLK